jgi:DNA-binding transcriptional ArsR family regulator
MIDKLFGSKTRVKLLHLFMNHPGQSFYVREITRLIDEQINSVRRELSNMLEVGIITSDSSDNKLYYQANQRYDFYRPLRAIFAGEAMDAEEKSPEQKASVNQNEVDIIEAIPSLRLAIFAGVLVKGSTATVDIILVGNVSAAKAKAAIAMIEKLEGRELNYTVLPYDEFYYRLSVRDKFITEVLASKHSVAVDKDNILNEK